MSGHSQFANIKHRKDRKDKTRSDLFLKLSQEILTAVKTGGNNPEQNASLRNVIVKAKKLNMPLKKINSLLETSDNMNTGKGVSYEFLFLKKIPLIITVYEQNHNKIAAKLRHLASKHNTIIVRPNTIASMYLICGCIALKFTYQSILEQEKIEQKLLSYLIDFNDNHASYYFGSDQILVFVSSENLSKAVKMFSSASSFFSVNSAKNTIIIDNDFSQKTQAINEINQFIAEIKTIFPVINTINPYFKQA